MWLQSFEKDIFGSSFIKVGPSGISEVVLMN